jgi:class 3 adenylate cyclase
MSQPAVPEYRVMLTVDIEDYSSRTDTEQQVLQASLRNALDNAADAADLNRRGWLTQFSGDGLFAILPARTDVTRLMDHFMRELDAELGGYNRRRSEQAWARMRLRLAVHAGPVYLDGSTGWPGQHAVVPARLRDSEPVRAALAAFPGADLAVIVSSEIYRDYVSQGPGNPRPTEFRAVLAQVKKQSYVGHLLVPGHDVHVVAALARFDAPDKPAGGHMLPDTEGNSTAPGRKDSPPRSGGPPGWAGRDVIFGDSIKANGDGIVYKAGRDIVPPTDGSAGRRDER